MKKTITFFKSLLLAMILLVGSGSVWGQGTIYSENFGNPGTSTFKVNVYTGWSNAISGITYNADTGTDIRTSSASLITDYSGASGAGNVNIAASGRWFSISGINTEGFTNRVLSFGYRKGAGNGKTNTITAEYSTDGGVSWISINLLNTGTSGWYLYTSSTDFIPAVSNLILKFKSTAANDNRIDDVKIIGTAASTPTITPTFPISLSDFSTTVGTASASQTFTVGGTNLTSDLVITAPTGYEVRENNTETTFGSSVSFTPLSGTVATKTIEVRIAASAAVGTPEGNVVVSSTDATSQNVSVSGTVDAASTPTISLNSSSLSGFSYIVGSGPSAEQSFTVSGTNLTDNISLTAPADYEISTTSGSGFASSLIFTQSEGTVTAQTVYVRLKAGLTVETYNSETITAASNGATDKTVTLSGSVTNPPVPAAPTATAATDISATGFTANWGAAASATGYDVSVYTKSAASAPELVTNGGFENTLSTDDWGSNAMSFTVNNTGGHNAAKYLSRTGAATTLRLEQTVTTEVGKQYVFSFWYKGYTQSGNGIKNYTIHGTSGSNYIEGSGSGIPAALSSATEWTQYTKTFTATATSVTISIRSYVAASFDDISLKAVDDVITTTPISGSPFTVTGTSKAISGLNPGTEYFYTVVGKNASGSSAASNEISVTTPKITFTGTGEWTETARWNTGAVPGTTAQVVVDGTATINSDVEVAGLTINSGKSLTVNPAKQLTISGTATNNGTITIQSDASGTGTIVGNVSGAATVQQYLPGDGRQWWYLSSPVTGATSNVFAPTTSTNKIGVYVEDYLSDGNEATTSPYYTNPYAAGSSTPLSVGKGYVVKLSATTGGTYTFEGTLNNGDYTLTPTRTGVTAGKRGFNLVGNPYPSYLNWNAAYADAARTNVSNAIWYRTYSGGQMTFHTYADADGVPEITTGMIPPAQAFWIRVNADGSNGSITFKNTHREHAGVTANPLKAPKANDRPRVRLQISNGVNADEALIVAKSYASNGIDSYDIEKMSNDNVDVPEIYTLLNNQDMVINSFSSFVAGQEIALGMRPGKAGDFTINATQFENIPSDIKVILKDKFTGAETELSENASYSFNADGNEANQRFSLLFRAPGSVTGIDNAGNQTLFVYAQPSEIVVNGEELKGSNITVYTATGQSVMQVVAAGNREVLNGNFTPGVYFVKVNNTVKKVSVK